MALTLNTIKPAKGSTKRRKRVGRGNASGHGTTASRGTKGQRSRSGVSRLKLKRLGMRRIIAAMPKMKGFLSPKDKAMVVNLADLNKNFKENEVISPKTLFKKELISSASGLVKVLGTGELTVKGLKFEGVKVSGSAKAGIEKMGGKFGTKKTK